MRDFWKYTFASLTGLLIFCGLSVMGTSGLLLMLIASAGKDSTSAVKDKSVLVFDLSTKITDTQPSVSFSQALSNQTNNQITLRNALNSIDQAAKDQQIVALYLKGSNRPGETGYASLKEVRTALERFRATGKPIIAYDTDWEESEYYLASVANRVMINPFGQMEINGLASEQMFIAGALQKLGVGVQVTRVGKYKSAVEPLILTKSSPADKEQTQRLLNDVWGEFLSAAAKSRKLTSQQLQAITSGEGLLFGDEAVKRKLVDQVAYFDEVTAELKNLTREKETEKSFRQVNLTTYAKSAESSLTSKRNSRNQVAVIYAEGAIIDGDGEGRANVIAGDRLAKELRQLRLDPDVKAVVLRVNSPGGSATASEVIQREVILTQKVKPVVVSMGDVAASGGYWISAYANKIFAESNTITGSIGVFGFTPNFQKLGNNLGITWDTVKTGPSADISSSSRPKTPQEMALLQRSVDRIYDQFLSKVADGRKLPKQKVAEIAQGRVWSGIAAKQLGLVDELGGLDAAIKTAAELAKLGDNWQLEEYPKTRSFSEQLLKRLGDEQEVTQVDPMTAQFQKFQEELAVLQTMNDPLEVYARLPYTIKID